jgi:hypothetical protein
MNQQEGGRASQAHMQHCFPGSSDCAVDENTQYKISLWHYMRFPEGRFGPNKPYLFIAASDEEARKRISELFNIPYPIYETPFRACGGLEFFRLEGDEEIRLNLQ